MNKNLFFSIIVTKRCNAKCCMCDCHSNPTCIEEEISLNTISKLPKMKGVTITGGEPFLRNDLEEIVTILEKKSKRVLINTNGYFTERIVELVKRHPKIGIRISIDGFEETHNKIRGINIYQNAIRSLERLVQIRGTKDIGIGFTLQDINIDEMLPVYEWARKQNYEFGLSVVHNGEYYNISSNVINRSQDMIGEIELLIKRYLESSNPKDWFRAFFAYGEIAYIENKKKPLKCDAGKNSFFINWDGQILPCIGMTNNMPMGNLKTDEWNHIKKEKTFTTVSKYCKTCPINCWSICNLNSKFRNRFDIPLMWVLKRKLSNK